MTAEYQHPRRLDTVNVRNTLFGNESRFKCFQESLRMNPDGGWPSAFEPLRDVWGRLMEEDYGSSQGEWAAALRSVQRTLQSAAHAIHMQENIYICDPTKGSRDPTIQWVSTRVVVRGVATDFDE
ncbi:hypothetical protein TREMEDRAFT_60332 [Tremella mesenterica DSM 1558]|uniref:uncharacterized protein n=1 Tax=Tremella mesenterica (strain ATCC 24925 / CBS 8224 / DSM 1558 / NBRC 9311 / NRRL Y-6157 / RJB 2259-6 / UBC 559-6) TaxID=578456 RepID=UPI0003F4956A|nr:uncharacterized protein TREMEDRAFT_60332 [Tremella mesenterica DSM 1558]EIW71401.1 hypothetical protein TREMEDRAFT_60332 [Tremella mesenterica DSM 1558]